MIFKFFDELPPKLFEAHDLPVDVIVTPTEVFLVKDRLTKPDHIIWSLLTREKFNQIPILRELQFKEQKAGKIVQLKDESGDQDNENGNAEHSENGKSKTKSKKKPFNNKKKSAGKNSSNDDKTSGDELTPKKKQSNGDTKSPNSTEKSINPGAAAEKNSSNSNANGKPKKQKQYPATVSVFVGKIPRGTRVKELKEVLIAKGVKPINILWKGGKGYALIYCEKKEVPTSDELFEKLKNLTIGDNVLNVEPDKRIKPTATKDGETTNIKIVEKEVIETVVGSEAKNNKNPAAEVVPAKQVKPIVESAKQVKPIIKDEQVKPTAKIANGGAANTAEKTPTSNES